MTRKDLLNLSQVMLVGLNYVNLQMTSDTTVHISPWIRWTVGALLASTTLFVHLMAMDTPTDSQIITLGISHPPQAPALPLATPPVR